LIYQSQFVLHTMKYHLVKPPFTDDLILRSRAQRGVSKDGNKVMWPTHARVTARIRDGPAGLLRVRSACISVQ
jgi:hypothetical protein